MDIGYFAKSRIDFIELFYTTALTPFSDIKFKIKNEIAPFEPPYSEDPEPAFLQEWIVADQSIDVLGLQCMSLLASTLHLFLKEWVINVFRLNHHQKTRSIKTEEDYKSTFNKSGWFNGYLILFKSEFGLDWHTSGANLALLEELVLVRNRGQHPKHITTVDNHYSASDLSKINSPFFVDDLQSTEIDEKELWSFMPPRIKPTPEKFLLALNELKKFVTWLDSRQEDWTKNS